MTTERTGDSEALATALDHVWSWYQTSLSHRLQVANFVLLLSLANIAGYVTALQAKLYIVAGFLGIFATLSIVISGVIVGRSRERQRAAAVPLKLIQARLADMLRLEELKMVEFIESPRSPWRTTGRLATVMYVLTVVVFVGASIYAFLRQ